MGLPWVYGLFLSLMGGKMGLQKAILEGKLAPSHCSKWKKARAAVRRRNIYYCGNDTSTQFFTASVAEELLLNTELTEESKARAIHLLKEFGLYEYRDAHPSTLSGGQKQRLAIACAVFSAPAGSSTAMVVPLSELSSTQTEPPWRSAISHTRESPSPAPPYSRLRDLSTRKKGWKMLR